MSKLDEEHLTKLKSIAKFLPIFDATDFKFGEWTRKKGQFPFFSLSTPALEFIKIAYDTGWVRQFSWTDWQGTDEARLLLNDCDFLARSDVGQLEKLLTTLIRKDRFSEGLLAYAYESGLLTSIIRRAASIIESNAA